MRLKRKKIKATIQNLRWRKFGYLRYLVTGYFLPRMLYWLTYSIPRPLLIVNGIALFALLVALPIDQLSDACGSCYRARVFASVFTVPVLHAPWLRDLASDIFAFALVSGLVLVLARYLRQRDVKALQQNARVLTEQAQATLTNARSMRWSELPIAPDVRKAVDTARSSAGVDEFVLARMDSSGRVRSMFGPLPFGEPAGDDDLPNAASNRKEIVLVGDQVLVCKDFADRQHFLHEWCCLAALQGKANVPTLVRVDETNHRIYMNFIPGRTLLGTPVTAGILSSLEKQMDSIHKAGVVNFNLAPANIILEQTTNTPWFVDFTDAQYLKSPGNHTFTYRRDLDRIRFNEIYGRNLITEKSARQLLRLYKKWGYAPVDFGGGLAVGEFWMVNSGTGRWEFLNRQVMPPVAGKRVLDLGSNNGSMPMMMLRAGASEVIGLELRPQNVEKARVIQRIYEWRDMRRYNLKMINANMLEMLHQNFGKFDLVTAFCSIYYLDEQDMARVVGKAAELAPIMIIQANDKNRQSKTAKEMARKKSVPYLEQLLKRNGFPYVEVIAPPGYSRPLLIGRKEALPVSESVSLVPESGIQHSRQAQSAA